MKKLIFILLPLIVIVVIALHFVPIYSKSVIACAISSIVRNGRMIDGSTKAGIDSQLQSLQNFNSNTDCVKGKVTYKLYVL